MHCTVHILRSKKMAFLQWLKFASGKLSKRRLKTTLCSQKRNLTVRGAKNGFAIL